MWGTDLWDQYDAVCGHIDNRIDQVKRLSSFVKDRVKVEQDYAKELRKLSKAYCKMKSEETKFVSTECFVKAVQHAEEMAQHHENFSNKLQSDVYDALKKLAVDQAKEKKSAMSDAAKQQSGYSAALSSNDKMKKKYESAQQDADKAVSAHQKADADMTLSRAAVEKIRKTSEAKTAEAEDAKSAYQNSIDETNTLQHEHFHSKMPVVFQQLQDLDEKRTTEMCSSVRLYCQLESELIPSMTESQGRIFDQCASITPGDDSDRLVEEIASGQPIPGDLFFDDVSMGSQPGSRREARKMTTCSSASVNDLFENLPAPKRRKKLSAKIAELKASTKKDEAELKGLQKLVSVYSDNPSLGDAAVVQDKIQPLVSRCDTANDDLYRCECALAQMDGKDMPAPPASLDVGSNLDSVSQASFHIQATDNSGMKETWDDEFDDSGAAQRCRVLYDFTGSAEGEISVAYGETLDFIQDDGSGWISVRRGAESGYIPLSYVEML